MSDVSKRIANLSPEKLELLAQLLKQKGGVPAAGSRITRRPDPGAPAPLSFAQQRLWLLDQMYAGESAFNIAAAVRLRGELDAGALGRALSGIVRRHEALRTTFSATTAGPVQTVNPPFALALPVTDLRHLAEDERRREVARLVEEEARRPFDLARGPLLRASLLRLEEDAHVLLLSMHHIVSDGHSLGVIVKELGALYAADRDGRPAPLAELPVQYADFAEWQQGQAADGTLRAQLDYWVRTLDGAPRVLELPHDYARPRLQSFRGALAARTISPAVTGALRGLARAEGATLYMTLLAGFSLLLHRYTGLEDIVVGAPVAGRNRAETEDLVGCFLNSLALRIDLGGRPTFRELLRRVRETTLGAYSHQDVAFEQLIESLQVERDLSRTPLFQVFFNMPNVPQEVTLAGLDVELLPTPESGSKFDLTLYVQEEGEGIRVTASYSTDLFRPSRIEELLRQYELLLTQVAARADDKLAAYSLVTEEARRQLPDPSAPLDGGWLGSAAELFTRQARRVPARTAVKDPRESWTYGELDERSNQLAHFLVAHGVGRGDVVAIYTHRSAPLVWSVLGVLKAGAAFVMLDPSYPAARLIDCLDIAAPRAWLQLTSAGALPPALEAYVGAAGLRCRLALGPRAEADDPLKGVPTGAVDAHVGPDDLAYIAFTSGSTGRPKGIAGRQGPLTHFLPWLEETFGLCDTDRFTMLSGLSHDPLHRDIFTPLALGASLHIPDPGDIGAPGRLPRWMQREGLTVAHLTPAMAQLLTEEAAGEVPPPVESLRYTFLVGDVLTRQDVARLRRLAPSVTCVNYFGTTETQRAVSYHVTEQGNRQDSDGPVRKEVLPLGRGIRDVQLLVLNASGALAGIGEAGEIYMRSPHLARGYVGDEALTAERFLPNHFTHAEGDRLYRTGDLGRYLPDGGVEPLGRADQQVKVRGFRIELGEVEAALRSLEGVGNVAVVAAGEAGSRRLVGYVVAEEGERVGEGWTRVLRERLRERLPEYMVPALLVELEELPVTPNGKVDRKGLAERAAGETSKETWREGSAVAGRTELERALCRMWGEVLGAGEVGIGENFFELGGHSLLAARLLARVRAEFGVEVGLRAMFEEPTVEGLAAAIESGRKAAMLPLTRVERGGPLPLSFAQQRLWFLDELEPGSALFNLSSTVHIRGRLDEAALARGLSEVVRRHEVLRTTFAVEGGRPIQVINEPSVVELPLTDLSGLDAAGREAEARLVAAREAALPFDLGRGPLLRARLIRLAADEHIAVLVMHHIVSDGWSMGVLVKEVAALYAAFAQGEASPLPELPVQYADFAAWQREWLKGEVLERQLGYWRERLAGAPSVLELPTERPRPSEMTFRGGAHRMLLSEELARQLKALAQAEGCTLFMTLLGAFKVLLRFYTGREDLVVGTDIAGRSHSRTEGLIGFFVNQLVLRTSLAGDPEFVELLGRVRQVSLAAYDHQDVPFEQLVEALNPERSRRHMPLFQHKLTLQNAPEVALTLPGLDLTLAKLDNGVARLDLTLLITERPGGLEVYFEYNSDLFEPATVAAFAELYEALLGEVVERPRARLAELEGALRERAEERRAAARRQREASRSERFKGVKPRAVSVRRESLVRTGFLGTDETLPLVLSPASAEVEAAGWVAANSELVTRSLDHHGAVLFRGFGLDTVEKFSDFAGAVCSQLFTDNGEHTRKSLNGAVYTPVFYPPEKKILWHNENSFNREWPTKIIFGCLRPATSGGATPLVDSRRVFERLAPALRSRFMEKGVMYVRNYGDRLGLHWSEVFRTSDRREVEAACRATGTEFVWKEGDRLRTSAVRPAAIRHPRTGEWAWFNQAQHWHVSCLDTETRRSVESLFDENDLPRQCYYGDGTPIEDSVMEEILEVYASLETSFLWEMGDAMLVDNVSAAHARNPFTGERRLLVAMGEMLSYETGR